MLTSIASQMPRAGSAPSRLFANERYPLRAITNSPIAYMVASGLSRQRMDVRYRTRGSADHSRAEPSVCWSTDVPARPRPDKTENMLSAFAQLRAVLETARDDPNPRGHGAGDP